MTDDSPNEGFGPTLAGTPTRVDISERDAFATGGWAILLLTVLLLLGGAAGIVVGAVEGDSAGGSGALAGTLVAAGVALVLTGAVLLTGFAIIRPGETRVVTFFGTYMGTIRRTGLSWTVPLSARRQVPVRVLNFETERLKVNERTGSPVVVSAIVVWQVADTAKAVFAVDDYDEFIRTQAESALRHVVASHPYDQQTARSEGEDTTQVTLREDGGKVSVELASEVGERVVIAGLEVVEVRLSNLSYAPEIASAMLQRQQAQAVLDAREVMILGAVGLVTDALDQLGEQGTLELDPERRAAMTSNLMTVLVGGSAQPVVNVGSLYS
ncbi:SPFH domain-containing protein [Nocardioides alkalitolerans]|uniref:SPFH domain-containing protein n=1 Tax=Nocardioides alkalitolerans TaxID=281714 RepID=UPI00042A8BBD|nr:SPFH domain-containing protein [Nocardioides alkalitolerans]